MMLWFLRTPLMRRTIVLVLVLAIPLAVSARAASVPHPRAISAAHSAAPDPKFRHSASAAGKKSRPAPARAAAGRSTLAHSTSASSLPRRTSGASRRRGSARSADRRVLSRAHTAPATGLAGMSASADSRHVALRTRRGATPSPLKGSLESLEHQNAMSEAEGLERIEDENDLADRIALKLLVPVPTSAALAINEKLPEGHRYCRPWTAEFLAAAARAHQARFRRPLMVSSAVRTVEYQKQLMQTNGNAAAAEGDIVSPHLTGATVDLAKTGMSRQEIAWMRGYLLPLEKAGLIDVEEEFRQACFHITVYKNYAPPQMLDEAKAAPKARARRRKPMQAASSLATVLPG